MKNVTTRLPAERAGREAPLDLQARRQAIAAALQSSNWRSDASIVETSLGGVRVLRFQPTGLKRGTVFHLHGGGFRIGCPEMETAFDVALAARCGVEVVCPAYRLAPENPYPSGLADAYNALVEIRREGGDPLSVSGDSAGGGLAASVTALCVAENVPLSGLLCLSAWLDLTQTSPTFQSNAATDPLFSLASAREAAELYLQGHSPTDPLVSPLLGSVAGFPRTYVSIGAGEVLANDGLRFYNALRAAGVTAELHRVPGMEHVAVTRNLALAGAAETFERVVAFIDAVCSPK